MTSAGGSCIKEGILLTVQEYTVLKEDIKDDECGWSEALLYSANFFYALEGAMPGPCCVLRTRFPDSTSAPAGSVVCLSARFLP
jgi:hypothetical protein